MTREEAIKQLKICKSFHNGSYGTAIDLAIKALEQQPCDEIHGSTYGGVSWGGTYKPQQSCEDCISREEAINLVHDLAQPCDDRYDWDISADEMIDGIKDLPSVIPQTRWIPVSERLPKNNGTYLVWDKYGYQISDFNAEEQTFGFLNDCNFDYETGEVYPPRWVEHYTVIAWMPLPKPYEEVQDE